MYRKSTILLVDDEEMIKRRLRDVIADDYEVLDASNGQEALEILAANIDRVAVIVLDLIMPVMDGFQFMDEFRRHQEYDNIPVIVATSNEDWHSEKKCLEAGVWDFVMKPYNPVLLQFRIRNAIDKSRMIMTERDAVTGLFTRFKFYQEVRLLLSEENEETLALVRFDIDRFKMINNFTAPGRVTGYCRVSLQSCAGSLWFLTGLSMGGWKMMSLRCACLSGRKISICW